MQKLLPLSLLDFPAELIANSMVCLWNDLASEDSRSDFLRFQKGWIPHAILLGCLSGNAAELVARFIEIACFLDLLCQEHGLASTIVEALKSKSISRLTLWEKIPTTLVHNMDEISLASLASCTTSDAPFRAPRDVCLEYWLLTRPYVSGEGLFAESLHIQPERQKTGDVETRINQLEALVSAINDVDGTKTHSFGTDKVVESLVSDSTDAESLDGTDSGDSDISFSEPEILSRTDIDSVYHLALQTKERISQQLECIKDNIHRKAHQSASNFGALGIPIQGRKQRTIDPSDQKSTFQTRANLQSNAHQRRASHSTAHHNPRLDHAQISVRTRFLS
jgi:hypothetical protein